jgi:hypothetical protein
VGCDFDAGVLHRSRVLDETCLRGRASHVERQDAVQPKRFRDARGGEDPCRGAGLDHPDRTLACESRRRRAAVRLHDPQLVAVLPEVHLELIEVGRDDRHERGVDDRGARALVLLDLGIDLG